MRLTGSDDSEEEKLGPTEVKRDSRVAGATIASIMTAAVRTGLE